MQAERWERINAVFDLAVEMGCAQQERFVQEAAAGDDELAAEVLSLLRAAATGTTIRSPLAEVYRGDGAYETNGRDAGPLTSSIEVTDDRLNEKIGSYRLLERIGAGGMGVVYRAYDEVRDRFVALKTLQRTQAATLDRFKREFRAFAGLGHPNLVALYELIAERGRWCFTMELVEGRNFLDYISGGAPNGPALDEAMLQRLRCAFRQLAGAVAALHAAEKLHRDLKPSNVLVTPGDRVVVLDFGLGVELDRFGMHDNTEDHVVGSVPYMSPEQAGCGKVSTASDWYSVGVILYRALTGRMPFEGSPLRVLEAKRESDGEPPAASNPATPDDLNALCTQLLRKNPADRPEASAILERLGARLERASGAAAGGVSSVDALFVGRGSELECLHTAYKMSRRRPVVVYVTGYSGAGKTSLVQRFLTEIAGDPESVVLTGRCLEHEFVPFKALDSVVDCLVRYLRRLKPEQLGPLMPRDIRVLARVFPALLRIPGVAEAPVIGSPDPDPVELRHRAAAALRELLARLGDRHPLVLFIDDLQWGDRDSASLLTDIMTPPYAPNFLGIGCYRSEDAAGSPFLSTLQEFRTRAPLPYEEKNLTIGELEPEATRELARRILPSQANASGVLVDAIARESAGRPFLVYELVEHFKSSEDGLLKTESLTLDDVLWQRIEALPEESRNFLETVAISGRPIEEIDAFRAAGLAATDALVVAALKASRLIRGAPAGARNRIEVYHDRVRQVVLDHLPPSSLEGHHLRLARVFSASDRADPELLAFHLTRGGQPEEAAEHYVIAARKAAEFLAFEQAALLYRQALDLKAWAVDQQLALRTQLGDALNNAGQGAQAAREYLAVTPYADPVSAIDFQHRASLALLTTGHVDAGLSCLSPVMKSIGTQLARSPAGALLSLLTRRMRLRIRGLSFKERAAEAVSPAALRRIDIGWSVVIGLSVIDPIRGADFQARSLLLALAAGEPFRVTRALAVEAAHLASSGSLKRAKKVAAEAERLASMLQRPYTSGIVELARGAVAYFEEKWSDSLRFCRAAAATFRLHCTGATWEINTANAFTLWSLVKLGAIAELSRICPALLKEARDRGDLYAIANLSTQIMGLVRLSQDDPEGARDELNLIMGQWSQNGYHVQHHDALLAFVPLELYVSDPEAAWNRVDAEWSKFRRSLLSHVQELRVEMLQLRAYCALAMAQKFRDRPGFLSVAKRDAKKLHREGLPWTIAFYEYISGAVDYLQGDCAMARGRLSAAVSAFDSLEAGLMAAVTRRRLADISPGQEAVTLRETADQWLQSQAVVNPDRMVQAFAPGFPS
jgi:hypothetical protein